ncbi:Cation channel sperm-associated protein [Trichinella spiralis]|uniref:Cation channel sperm-associated protein n=1 Tax=Trichinella spiralis TaxID=6334 RepID=A0ABR3KYC0_TRISP
MVNYDGRHNMVGQNRQPQVRMVSHVQLGRLRCGKGPSSHVSSPVTGQCPKIELFSCVIVYLDKLFLSLFLSSKAEIAQFGKTSPAVA